MIHRAPLWWHFPHFRFERLASPDTGENRMDKEFMFRLQGLRLAWGRALVVNSGYRTKEYNRRIGGAQNSLHLDGRAVDIRMRSLVMPDFIAAARAAGFTGIGAYPKRGFVHIDDRDDLTFWTE